MPTPGDVPSRTALVIGDPADLPAEWVRRGRRVVVVMLDPEELVTQPDGRDAARPGDDELVRLLADGHTQEAIARRLGLSLRTVQRRLAAIRRQLGVDASHQIPTELLRRGLL
jgi:DNA-binding NarL/FixJ family response regulator